MASKMNWEDNPDLSSIFQALNDRLLDQIQPLQDELRSVLERSEKFLKKLQGNESFAVTLDVPLISADVMERIELLFGSASPRLVHPETMPLATPISWISIVTDINSKVVFKGCGVYEYRLLDLGVIVELSEFQHNMMLSGLPQKLIRPWSYKNDIQTEIHALSSINDMTTLSEFLVLKGEPTPGFASYLFCTDLCYRLKSRKSMKRFSMKSKNETNPFISFWNGGMSHCHSVQTYHSRSRQVPILPVVSRM